MNLILFEIIDMKTSVSRFFKPCCICMTMCTLSLLLLHNNPVLKTAEAHVVPSYQVNPTCLGED